MWIKFEAFEVFFFSSHKKLFFGVISYNLLHLLYSRWKVWKRVQYAWNYSGTRFLSSENWNYSISYWISSYTCNCFCSLFAGGWGGVLAAGEWVVCQVFFFLLFLKVYELIYYQHSLCFTGWWQWRNSGFKWNGQQDVPILCLSHSYLKNPQWCHIKVCHRGMKCSL